jgi:hypothetical protein
MSHLDPERLAALADDNPTAAEAAHLAQCIACSREREAYRTLLARAQAERELPAGPLTTWDALAAQLGAEGLIAAGSREGDGSLGGSGGGDSGAPARRKGMGWMRPDGRGAPWWLQAAAAVLLVAAGVVAGRASAASSSGGSIGKPNGDRVADARFVSGDTTAKFGSVVEAQAVLTRAEREYRKAMEFLAANDTAQRLVTNADLYRARLAALDAMAASARQGVNEAPHDPVINQYYISTMAARAATLRQLDTTLRKEGVRLTTF